MKKLKCVFLIIFVILSAANLNHAQEKGTLRGVVKDSTNSEALPFGNVYIKELSAGASTNNRGYFVIPSIPSSKKYTVIVSFIGYKTKFLEVTIEPLKITELEILLSPSTIELQAIEKIEYLTEDENVPDIGKTVLTPKELEVIPKGVETDILRSLASLPGVQSTGDVSAKFNVRGGESNQNLVMLDGMPVYYPFHAIGLFGVIDPDVINNVEFFRGGYPANYGRAISSVLKIITKDGNKNRYSAKASGSLLSAKGMIEGPIPNGSFYFTGRKSVSNKILKKFLNENELPVDFYDAAFKVNYNSPNFFSGTKFTLQSLLSEDNLKYSDVKKPDYKWSNNVWGFKIFAVGDVPFFLDFGLNLSSFKNEIIPKESGIKPKLNEVYDFTISTDFLYVFDSKDELGIGVDVKSVKSKLFLVNRFNFQADVGLGDIGSNAYLNYKFLRFSNIGIDLGARFNIKNLAAKGDLAEPRISFNYLFTPRLSFKAAFGIYQQELTTITDEREVLSLFDPVIIIPEYLKKSKSTHYVVGVSTKLFADVTIDIEGYYKKIFTAPALNENKTSFSEPDLLESKGESYGAEMQLKFDWNPFDVAVAYSLSRAFKEVNGFKYSPRYDSRHNLNFSLTWNLPDDWQVSTSWVYHSGFPFTQQIGYYDRLAFNNFLNDYNIYQTLIPVQYFGTKNAARLPDYHRLDIIIAKKLDLDFVKMNLDLSAINVYDRKNIYYFEQNTGKRINMLPFLLTGTVKIEL